MPTPIASLTGASKASSTCSPRVQPRFSDEEIVAGLGRGESWAAEQLYDRVHAHVEASLRRILRTSGADFDDLLQASFERILRVLGERPLGSPCNLASWSSAVAAHVALDALRRRVREQKLFRSDDILPATRAEIVPGSGSERALDARAEISRVQGILGRMKPKYAQTVVLHDVLGHDLAQVARITGVSVAAAQSRLVRGRKDLLRRARGEGLR